jgi:hypothetical protein
MSLLLDTQQFLQKVWTDTRGTEFLIDDVHGKDGVMWVEYHRVHDNTYYNCLLPAFTARFSPKEPKQ